MARTMARTLFAPAGSDKGHDVRAADKQSKTTTSKQPSDYPADNTGRNVRDQAGDTVTPIDQSQAKADMELTQRIRQALMDDSTLSMTAQNIKVISQNGMVTLRGPVKDQAELDNIVAKAREIAGPTRVDNQLEIKGT